jgi:large subunit ribosomal protein L23
MNATVAKAAAKTADKAAKKSVTKREKAAKAPKAAKPAKAPKVKAPKAAKADGSTRTSPYAAERLMTLLLAPVISEKGTHIADKYEQVVFRVAQDATKPQVKAAVELMFKVDVESVQISNVRGKQKRFGQFMGRRRSWKKAYVSLKPGQEINFAQEA